MIENQSIRVSLSIKILLLITTIMFLLSAQTVNAASNLVNLPSGKYSLDKSHASIVWKISHLGLSPYVARFTDFDIDLLLDTNDLSKSTVSASINALSISTENKKFNEDLIGKAWFKTEKFPTISFTSTAYKSINDQTGKLIGTIEMFGIKKPVEFDVTLGGAIDNHPFIANSVGVGFTAKTVIERSDWGFSKFVPTVGDEVTIEIAAEFSKKIDVSN